MPQPRRHGPRPHQARNRLGKFLLGHGRLWRGGSTRTHAYQRVAALPATGNAHVWAQLVESA